MENITYSSCAIANYIPSMPLENITYPLPAIAVKIDYETVTLNYKKTTIPMSPIPCLLSYH